MSRLGQDVNLCPRVKGIPGEPEALDLLKGLAVAANRLGRVSLLVPDHGEALSTQAVLKTLLALTLQNGERVGFVASVNTYTQDGFLGVQVALCNMFNRKIELS